MATAGTITYALTTVPGTPQAVEPCTTLLIRNDNTVNVLVSVTGIHDSGEFFVIKPDGEVLFRHTNRGITEFTYKNASAVSGDINWSIVAKTRPSHMS